MRKLNIFLILLGLLLIADLVTFVLVVFFDNPRESAVNSDILRIGVVADADHPENRKVMEAFFQEVDGQADFELRPCYAASYEEAVMGFIHGSVDLLIINPACFLTLKEKYNAKALVRQRFSRSENEYNHAVLMTTRKLDGVGATRGLRLAFKDRYSMGGYLVPSSYLSRKLPVPASQWFKSVSYTSSDHLSLRQLLDGKVDVIAVDLLSLVSSDLFRRRSRDLNMFWISHGLPETLICVSFQSEYFARNDLLQKIAMTFWSLSRRDAVFNRSSMFFEPIDYQYEGELKRLDDFLKGKNTEPGAQ